MKRFNYHGTRAVLVLACLMWLLAAQSSLAAEPKARFRDIVYRLEELGKAVGKPIKEVYSLEYKILLLTDGEEKSVDPKTHEFNVGDRIRLTVEPLHDSYIYIFHIGPSGKQGFLLPREGEQPPHVEATKVIRLPSQGHFAFVPPPGDEKLLVVAADHPVADRSLLANVLTKKPEDYSEEEVALRKRIIDTVEKNLKSVQERETEVRDKVVKFRGLTTGPEWNTLVRDVRMRSPSSGTIEEPPQNPNEGTLVVRFSMADDNQEDGQPKLSLIYIPLISRGSTSLSP